MSVPQFCHLWQFLSSVSSGSSSVLSALAVPQFCQLLQFLSSVHSGSSSVVSALAVNQSCLYFKERVIFYIYTVFYIVTIIPTVYFGLYILNLHDVIESESSVQWLPLYADQA